MPALLATITTALAHAASASAAVAALLHPRGLPLLLLLLLLLLCLLTLLRRRMHLGDGALVWCTCSQPCTLSPLGLDLLQHWLQAQPTSTQHNHGTVSHRTPSHCKPQDSILSCHATDLIHAARRKPGRQHVANRGLQARGNGWRPALAAKSTRVNPAMCMCLYHTRIL